MSFDPTTVWYQFVYIEIDIDKNQALVDIKHRQEPITRSAKRFNSDTSDHRFFASLNDNFPSN